MFLLFLVFAVLAFLMHDLMENAGAGFGVTLMFGIFCCVSFLFGVSFVKVMIDPSDLVKYDDYERIIAIDSVTSVDNVLALSNEDRELVKNILQYNGTPIYERIEQRQIKNYSNFWMWPKFYSCPADTLIRVRK